MDGVCYYIVEERNKKSERGDTNGNDCRYSQQMEHIQKLGERSESNVLITFSKNNERGESKGLISGSIKIIN